MSRPEYNSLAIAGEAGSGKTSVAQALGKLLGWEVFGAGELFREWCERNDQPTIAAQDGQDIVHDYIDEMMREKMILGKTVVEGRVAGLVAAVNELPGVLKVLLVCNADERYRRILDREIKSGKIAILEQVIAETDERETQNLQVFSERYGMSYLNTVFYDLVIDNTGLSLGDTVDIVTHTVMV